MRLMLGEEGKPSLLVSVTDDYNKDSFDFYVVNGGWEGTLTGDTLRIYYDYNKVHFQDVAVNMKILTDNQQRLTGEYNEVFDNFDNEDWVSPEHGKKRVAFEDEYEYDDIAF